MKMEGCQEKPSDQKGISTRSPASDMIYAKWRRHYVVRHADKLFKNHAESLRKRRYHRGHYELSYPRRWKCLMGWPEMPTQRSAL